MSGSRRGGKTAAEDEQPETEAPPKDLRADVPVQESPAFLTALDSLNVGELRKVITYAEARIREREAGERSALREKLLRIARDSGFGIEDLFGDLMSRQPALAPVKRGRKPKSESETKERAEVKPKYKGPADQLWSGRGRRPIWAQGMSDEDLAKYLIDKPPGEAAE